MLLFGSPAVAQDVTQESFPPDISAYFTDPIFRAECDPEMVFTPSGDVQMTWCPQQVAAPAPAAPPAPTRPVTRTVPVPRMMSPFPMVRLAGSVTQAGTHIQLLQVWAPKGARALIRCRGQGCPVKRVGKTVRGRPLRVPAVERLVPAGVVLEVLVRRGASIGKFTRFRFRHYRRPLRRDGCLWPGTTRMAPCPG
jgi:hypothetical protein